MKLYLHIYDRNDALGLVKMSGNPVDRLWDKVQHQVEVHFIFLRHNGRRETVSFTGMMENDISDAWNTKQLQFNNSLCIG